MYKAVDHHKLKPATMVLFGKIMAICSNYLLLTYWKVHNKACNLLMYNVTINFCFKLREKNLSGDFSLRMEVVCEVHRTY